MSTSNYEVGCSLDCPVCLEPYDLQTRLPKMMSCLHTTCLSCILLMIEAKNPETTARTPGPTPPVRAAAARAAAPTEFTSPAAEQQAQARRLMAEFQTIISSRFSNPSGSTATHSQPAKRGTNSSAMGRLRSLGGGAPTASGQKQDLPNAPPPTKQLPKGVTFSCPMCRTQIRSDVVQTNRYVIAHIEDVIKMKRLTMKLNSPVQGELNTKMTAKISLSTSLGAHIQDLNRQSKDFWCVECQVPTDEKKCINHEKVPLKEWNQTQCRILLEQINQVEKGVTAQLETSRGLEKELRTIFTTTRTLLGKAQSQNKEWNRIKGRLEKQKRECESHNQPAVASSTSGSSLDGVIKANRVAALKFQEEMKQLDCIRNDLSKMENEGLAQGDCILWSNGNKLYLKNGTSTFTIVTEDSDYAA